jgi:glycosyltransferase involved in cell wall biosynthesis
MNVLYVNHTAEVSGGERSLLALLGALPGDVRARAPTPPGDLRSALEARGVPATEMHGTAGSLRLHPLHTPRALAEMALAAQQVRIAARRSGAAVMHANSIRAGIVLALARPAPRAASVVHVRDCLPPGAVTSATMRLIAASADVVVANSRYTAASVLASAPGARVEVVYNPVDLGRFDPAKIDRAAARASLGAAGDSALLLGVVAQLTPWKGQETAIRALAQARREGVDAHLLLIGSAKFVFRATRFDNEAYVAHLRALIESEGLRDHVSWLGERDDVPELVRALDVLLLPSHEEPFGRALIEAMALGVPVLATRVGGPPEIVQEGREGHLLDPHDPSAWAAAITALSREPDRREQMGRAGRERALSEFGAARHAEQIVALYRRISA